MQLIRIRCTNCGAEFENVSEGQRLFRCTRKGCGAVFLVDQGRRFSDIEAFKAEQIQALRDGLRKGLSPFDAQRAELYAHKILGMIPEDFRARTALCLCQSVAGNPLALRRLLEGEINCPEEEFLEMFPALLAHCEYRELMALQGATEACVSGRGQEDCLIAIERRKEELRQKSDCYADIPRDVFICHSSVDSAKARRVAAVLEEDGNQCWISSRNLPPDAPDYWARIERAIKRCRVFLVLCSEASMLSKDVQRELGIAEKTGNARLEIKLDSKPHTTQFRYFFDGVTWIDATGGIEGALTQAKQRVFAVLHAKQENLEPSPESLGEPSQTEDDMQLAHEDVSAGGHAHEEDAYDLSRTDPLLKINLQEVADGEHEETATVQTNAVAKRERLKPRERLFLLGLLLLNILWAVKMRQYLQFFASVPLVQADYYVKSFLELMPGLPCLVASVAMLNAYILTLNGLKKAAWLSLLPVWVTIFLMEYANQAYTSERAAVIARGEIASFMLGTENYIPALFGMLICFIGHCVAMFLVLNIRSEDLEKESDL